MGATVRPAKGRFSVDPAEGGGTVVSLELPVG